MNKLRFGFIAGVVFGLLDIIPMFGMQFDDKAAAIVGAFLNRFAIGLLVPTVDWPGPSWLRGVVLGLLLSVPDALITRAYAPILGTGLLGGLVIGVLAGRAERAAEAAA